MQTDICFTLGLVLSQLCIQTVCVSRSAVYLDQFYIQISFVSRSGSYLDQLYIQISFISRSAVYLDQLCIQISCVSRSAVYLDQLFSHLSRHSPRWVTLWGREFIITILYCRYWRDQTRCCRALYFLQRYRYSSEASTGTSLYQLIYNRLIQQLYLCYSVCGDACFLHCFSLLQAVDLF